MADTGNETSVVDTVDGEAKSADSDVLQIMERVLEEHRISHRQLARTAGLDKSVLSRLFSAARSGDNSLSDKYRGRLFEAWERMGIDGEASRNIRILWDEEARRRQSVLRIACPGTMVAALPILAQNMGYYGADPIAPFRVVVDWGQSTVGVTSGQDVIQSVMDSEWTLGIASGPIVNEALRRSDIVPIAVIQNAFGPRFCVSSSALEKLGHRWDRALFEELFADESSAVNFPKWVLYHSDTRTMRLFVAHIAHEIAIPRFCEIAENARRHELAKGLPRLSSKPEDGIGVPYSMVVTWAPHTFEIYRQGNKRYCELVRVPRNIRQIMPSATTSDERTPREASPAVGRSGYSSSDIFDVCARSAVDHVLFGRPGAVVDNPRIVQTIFEGIDRASRSVCKARGGLDEYDLRKLCAVLWQMARIPYDDDQSEEGPGYAPDFDSADASTQKEFASYVQEELRMSFPSVLYHARYVNRLIPAPLRNETELFRPPQ